MFQDDLNLEVNQMIKTIKEDKENWTIPKIREDIIKNK